MAEIPYELFLRKQQMERNRPSSTNQVLSGLSDLTNTITQSLQAAAKVKRDKVVDMAKILESSGAQPTSDQAKAMMKAAGVDPTKFGITGDFNEQVPKGHVPVSDFTRSYFESIGQPLKPETKFVTTEDYSAAQSMKKMKGSEEESKAKLAALQARTDALKASTARTKQLLSGRKEGKDNNALVLDHYEYLNGQLDKVMDNLNNSFNLTDIERKTLTDQLNYVIKEKAKMDPIVAEISQSRIDKFQKSRAAAPASVPGIQQPGVSAPAAQQDPAVVQMIQSQLSSGASAEDVAKMMQEAGYDPALYTDFLK